MNQAPLIPLLSPHQNSQNFSARFSGWISLDLLIDDEEMNDLFNALSSFYLVSPQNANPASQYLIEPALFLDRYSKYIQALKTSQKPNYDDFKKYFYSMLCANLEGVGLKKIREDRSVVLFRDPYIEMKPLSLLVSSVDQTIRTSVGNADGISWGLRLSMPQIYQEAQTLISHKIDFQKHPLGQLFKTIRTWLREKTRSTPFLIHSKKVQHPVRLGKKCFEWINKHPQLLKSSVQIAL